MNGVKTYNNSISILSDLNFDDIVIQAVIFGVSAASCAILIMTYGNVLAALGFITVLSIILITFYRVDWGFYVFISMVLLFDQFHIPGRDPITYKVDYFKNLKEISFIPHFSAGVINPIEFQLILMLLAWFLAISVRKRTPIQHVNVWGLGVIFFCMLITSFIHGLGTGGDFLPALWELRALFYFGFLFFFVPQIIQSKEQVKALMWVFIIFISIKAFQGTVRFVSQGLSFRGFETLTNHEDAVFITLLLIMLLGLIIIGGNKRQKNVLLALFTILILGFYSGQRRAAYAGLIISLIAFIILINKHERKILFKAAFPFIIFIIIYSAAFWNSNSKLASPVKLIKSGISLNKKTDGERYLSNLYRVFERYNLAITSRSSLITGLGFGKKYKLVIPLPDIPFPLRDYIPHDEILWVFVKTGALGFFIFWIFFDSLIIKGSMLCKKMQDPYLRVISALIVIAIINQMVVSYYDLQLTYYRNMIVLGTLCGLLPSLESIDKKETHSAEINDTEKTDNKIESELVTN